MATFFRLKLLRGTIIAANIGQPEDMVKKELILSQTASRRQGIELSIIGV